MSVVVVAVELLQVGVADRLLVDIPVVDRLAAGSTAGIRMDSLELLQGIGMGSMFGRGCKQGMGL